MNVRLTIGRNVIIYGEGSIPLPPGNESGSVLIANSATPGDASFKTLEDAGIAKQDDLVQLAGENINNMMLGLNYSLTGSPVYENDCVKSSAIVWANKDEGAISFDDYNESEACFTSFQATNTNRSLRVLQAPVTFNKNGEIENYPTLIIETI